MASNTLGQGVTGWGYGSGWRILKHINKLSLVERLK